MVIGVDIGGTKMRAVLWNGKIKKARSAEAKTPNNRAGFGKEIQKIVRTVSGRGKITRIGIGSAGIVRGTTLDFSPNIPAVRRFNFSALWPSTVLVRADNDARCFARGEHLLGAGKKAKSVFAITVGTGVGRAYGEKGRIKKIKKFEYPERWEKEYQRVRDCGSDAALADFLGRNLAPVLARFNPEVVVIGGGVTGRRGFFEKMRSSLAQRGIAAKIRSSRLGKNAAAFGAVLFAKEKKA